MQEEGWPAAGLAVISKGGAWAMHDNPLPPPHKQHTSVGFFHNICHGITRGGGGRGAIQGFVLML